MTYKKIKEEKDFYNPELKYIINYDWNTMKQTDFMKKYKITRITAIAYLWNRDYSNNRYIDQDKKINSINYQKTYTVQHIETVEENYKKMFSKFQTTREEINKQLRDYTFSEILNWTCINWKLKPKENLKYYTK